VAEGGDDAGWIVPDVVPHEPFDAVAGGPELAVAATVSPSCGAGAMELPAVGLDDEAMRRPEEVHLQPLAGSDLDALVDQGQRQAGALAERQEVSLQPARRQ
jgi:hypothetical protein